MFLLLFTSLSLALAGNQDDSFVVVIDPGHGGKDAGAVGRKGKEKDINLAVALLTGKYIEEKYPDVKVIYTRKKAIFIALHERANIANKNHADLFISIHTNSVKNKTARGPEVFTLGMSRTKESLEAAQKENSVIYMEDDYEEKYEGFDPTSSESYIIFELMQNQYAEQSIKFADYVQKELVKCVSWKGRGVKQAGYLVLARSSMPRILIELDFISNPEAENFLLSKNGQNRYAKAIFDAFSKYKADYERKKLSNNQSTQKEKPANAVQKNKIETTEEVVYKVQILTSSKQLKNNSPQLKGYKVDFYMENKTYKYTYGESTDWDEINKIRKSLSKDFKDAFVIKTKDGVRIK